MTDPKEAHTSCHDEINAAFNDWSVTKAPTEKLLRWLVTLCTNETAEGKKERNRMRAEAIQHILSARLAAEAHRQSFVVAIAAFVASLFSIWVSYHFKVP